MNLPNGGLFDGLFDGDCLGGNEGGKTVYSWLEGTGFDTGERVNSLFGDTDFTVLTLALELRESLEEVKLILLRALLTCTTLSKVNFEGLGGWTWPNSYFLGAEDLGGGGGGGKSDSGGLFLLLLVRVSCRPLKFTSVPPFDPLLRNFCWIEAIFGEIFSAFPVSDFVMISWKKSKSIHENQEVAKYL